MIIIILQKKRTQKYQNCLLDINGNEIYDYLRLSVPSPKSEDDFFFIEKFKDCFILTFGCDDLFNEEKNDKYKKILLVKNDKLKEIDVPKHENSTIEETENDYIISFYRNSIYEPSFKSISIKKLLKMKICNKHKEIYMNINHIAINYNTNTLIINEETTEYIEIHKWDKYYFTWSMSQSPYDLRDEEFNLLVKTVNTNFMDDDEMKSFTYENYLIFISTIFQENKKLSTQLIRVDRNNNEIKKIDFPIDIKIEIIQDIGKVKVFTKDKSNFTLIDIKEFNKKNPK